MRETKSLKYGFSLQDYRGVLKKACDLCCLWKWITLDLREVVMPLHASIMFASGHSVTAGDRVAKGAVFRE